MAKPSARLALSLSFVLASLASVSPSGANTLSYGNFSAASVTFINVTEASVTDLAPLYGAPAVTGDTLNFSPTFMSSSSNGTPDTTSGTLQVRILAKPGLELISLDLTEGFMVQFQGSGDRGNTAISINGLILVQDMTAGRPMSLLPPVIPALSSVSPIVPPPGDLGSGLGSRGASAHVNLSGLGITQVLVTLNNNLQTLSAPGWLAEVSKLRPELQVTTRPEIDTPEPGSLVLLSLGGVAALRRRR